MSKFKKGNKVKIVGPGKDKSDWPSDLNKYIGKIGIVRLDQPDTNAMIAVGVEGIGDVVLKEYEIKIHSEEWDE